MASTNQIVKKSIQIDAGDTLRTVRSLKQEITKLRDALLNLEQGTEEYDEVQKRLTDDVNDLNQVMGAHKDKTTDLEGSYNSLQNQLKDLKKAWKETNNEAERNSLGEQIRAINDQLKSMDASIGDFHRNVGNYESAWNGLTTVMDRGEMITDDMEKGIKAFGAAMGLTDKQVNNLSKSLKAMKDGFKIAKDIARAQEETAKLAQAEQAAAAQGTALATTQKATATAAGTMAAGENAAAGATRGLSVAMNGLKAALLSTGIGALIVALGTMVGKLDEARSKLKSAKAESKEDQTVPDIVAEITENNKKQLEVAEELQERTERTLKAQGKTEKEALESRKKMYQEYLDNLQHNQETTSHFLERNVDGLKELENSYDEAANTVLAGSSLLTIGFKEIGKGVANAFDGNKIGEFKGNIESLEASMSANAETIEYVKKQIDDVEFELGILQIESENTTGELRKWADLVKDPKFQEAWKRITNIDFGGGSPLETIKLQRQAAVALVQGFHGETSEVEKFFDQMYAAAEDEFRSIIELEQRMFDERLTPAERLENEKQDWIKIADKWGIDSTNIVKYYDKKIQEELDKAEADRQAKEKEIEDKRIQELKTFLDSVDATLATNEKLDALFSPVFAQFTSHEGVAGEIQQDIDNLQRLYDTQMSYLNSLLESADLTEEAYAGIEERILKLTVEFNNQMDVLKKEQDYQGKNFAYLTKKQVANWNLMESAVSDFSDAFQTAGLENSKAYKGFATAQALISALLAANRVLAEEPGGIIMKSIAAAAALAAGLANVYAIWAVNPDGSNASSAAGTAGGGISAEAMPSMIDSEPYSYTSVIQDVDKQDELNKQPIWVSIVDVENALNRQVTVREESSF